VLSIIATVASLVLVGVRGLNLGVDFVGGQVIRTTFAQPVDVEQLRGRSPLWARRGEHPGVRRPRTYQIRLPKPEGGDAAANQAASAGPRHDQRSEYPGAGSTPSRRCRARSARSWPGTARWRSPRDARHRHLHLVPVRMAVRRRRAGHPVPRRRDDAGLLSLTQLQVDLNVVAAILTIVGYSLNDTVVIYDRIRENLRKYRKMAIVPLLNLSLNETLSRTMVTSLSILLALGVLLILGPEVIFGLTIAIFLGIFIGTYSSIYISAPILVWLGSSPTASSAWSIRRGRCARLWRPAGSASKSWTAAPPPAPGACCAARNAGSPRR
jgi:preprotein translocase subunit SecF